MLFGLNGFRSRVLVAALLASAVTPAFADGEVNIYTTREPGLIQPLLDTFTKETGIKTNAIFVESGLAERIEAEGANSPADLISVVDYGNLIDLVDRGLTQPIESSALDAAVPENLRDPSRQLVRALHARTRDLCVEGSRDRDRRRPTRSSPIRSGRAASASAPASTRTTRRCSPR